MLALETDLYLASAIHTKVKSSLITRLSCGNILKSPKGARTFWARVTSSVSAVIRGARSRCGARSRS